MALFGDVRTYTLSAAGRTIVATPSDRRQDDTLEISFPGDPDTAFDASVAIVTSNQAAAAVATDAHWSRVEGFEDLSPGTVYRVKVHAGTVGVEVYDAGTPSIAVEVV